jgi:hypothetical protein
LCKWLGWVGTAILIVAFCLLGEKHDHAFLLTFLGEALWTVKGYKTRQWDIFVVCLVFAVIALRNWVLWNF